MNKELRLTLKYFLQQKWEEVEEPFYIAVWIISLFFFMYIAISSSGNPWNWQAYVLVSVLAIIFLVVVIALLVFFFLWIAYNWETAKQRARKDVRNRGTKMKRGDGQKH